MWDVVVVGAGPAGSLAAYAAAGSGARTLLLDRAEFPRYKTCGGGLIGTSVAALPPGCSPTVLEQVTAATFSHRGGRTRTRREPEPMVRMVLRADFDTALADAAVANGATFQSATMVRSVAERAGWVELETTRGAVAARAVVGADGSASRIGNHVGVRCDQVDLGMEVELRVGEGAGDWSGRMHLDWGPLPGSYGWVFPKGDSLTVGVIAGRGRPEETRRYLHDLIDQLGLGGLEVVRSSGHLTRCRAVGSALSRGRVLVAGDAAGLLEPWTREGISFALRSGRRAGTTAALMASAADDAAVGALGDAYRDDLERGLGVEMAAGKVCLGLFARRPLLFHRVVSRTGRGWRAFVDISRGRTTIARELGRQPAATAVRLLERRARRRAAVR
ncbi:MAG TPA: geranylgeranyl reductase family protein [Micromonosporaceae bacterium]|nr:geranylgeranyl reductase family protein [Micromonosporaceae bacterium]